MHRLVFLFVALMLSAISLTAQVATNQNLEYSGGSFRRNGVKLDKQQLSTILTQSEMDMYKAGREEQIIGYVCTPVGALSIFGGGFLMADGFRVKADQSSGIVGQTAIWGPLEIGLGAVLVVGGAACTTFGIICLCKGHKTMLKLAQCHNNPSQTITLSPSRNGLGLALNF